VAAQPQQHAQAPTGSDAQAAWSCITLRCWQQPLWPDTTVCGTQVTCTCWVLLQNSCRTSTLLQRSGYMHCNSVDNASVITAASSPGCASLKHSLATKPQQHKKLCTCDKITQQTLHPAEPCCPQHASKNPFHDMHVQHEISYMHVIQSSCNVVHACHTSIIPFHDMHVHARHVHARHKTDLDGFRRMMYTARPPLGAVHNDCDNALSSWPPAAALSS
jgi:hypothetical protein